MRRLIWIAIVMFAASAAFAQSLAEVAKKEKERREKLEAEETRTITDVELRRAGGPPTLPTTASSTSSTDSEEGAEEDAAAGDEEEEEATDPRRTEEYWRGRLEPIDSRIQSLEQRLNSPQFTSNPTGAADRQRLEQQLAEARAQRQAVLDEARRAGAPPGWLR
jgi:hypothetical protein